MNKKLRMDRGSWMKPITLDDDKLKENAAFEVFTENRKGQLGYMTYYGDMNFLQLVKIFNKMHRKGCYVSTFEDVDNIFATIIPKAKTARHRYHINLIR